MPTSVTPVLSSSVGYLKDINEQITTLVRFVIMNPGWTSSLWEDQLVSFRKISSAEEKDRNSFAGILSTRIRTLLKNKFKDYNFETEFTVANYDTSQAEGQDDGRYTITFSIMIYPPNVETTTGIPGIIAGSIKVDEKSKELVLDYDKSEETVSIHS